MLKFPELLGTLNQFQHNDLDCNIATNFNENIPQSHTDLTVQVGDSSIPKDNTLVWNGDLCDEIVTTGDSKFYIWWLLIRIIYDDYFFVLFMMTIFCIVYDGYLFVLRMMSIYSLHDWWLFIRIMHDQYYFVLQMMTIYSYYVWSLLINGWVQRELTHVNVQAKAESRYKIR